MVESYEVESFVRGITLTRKYGLLQLTQHYPVSKKDLIHMIAMIKDDVLVGHMPRNNYVICLILRNSAIMHFIGPHIINTVLQQASIDQASACLF